MELNINTAYSLTNLQLELLKVFARKVSDDDVKAIRKMLVQYFAKKAMNIADQTWDEKGWTNQDAENMMREHHRKS